MSGVDYEGMRALQQQLLRTEETFEAFLRSFLLKQGLDVVARAKEHTPVDTGLLRVAWQVGDGKAAARGKWDSGQRKLRYETDDGLSTNTTLAGVAREGSQLLITITNPIEYASFVEYGHVTRDRKHFVEGKFMATLAINEVEALIPTRWQADFAAWISSLGGRSH